MMGDIDSVVERWNATLAAGDPAEVARVQRETLRSLSAAMMDDDPRAVLAGWTVGR